MVRKSKRKTMRLTHQKNNEIIFIRNRLNENAEFYSKTELNTYKLKLENFFSETDDNTEKFGLLKILLWIDGLYTKLYGKVSFGPWGNEVRPFSADRERYIQMGLKIKPKDVFFNFRNERQNTLM